MQTLYFNCPGKPGKYEGKSGNSTSKSVNQPVSHLEVQIHLKVENIILKTIKKLTYHGAGWFRVICYQSN